MWYLQTSVSVFKDTNPELSSEERTSFYRWGCHSLSGWVMGLGWQWNRSIQVTGQALQRLSAQANPFCKFKALHPEASSNLFWFRREVSCDPVSYISSYYLWLIVVITQPLCERHVASVTRKISQKSFQHLLCKSNRKMLNYLLFDIRKCSLLSVEICCAVFTQGGFFKINFVCHCWMCVPEKWLSITAICKICVCHWPPCMSPRSCTLTWHVHFSSYNIKIQFSLFVPNLFYKLHKENPHILETPVVQIFASVLRQRSGFPLLESRFK